MKDQDLKARSRGVSADMSSEAINRRLQIVAELYELATVLLRARPAGANTSVHEGGATYSSDPVDDGPRGGS